MPDRINNDFFLLNKGYSNYDDSTDLARHRWYYYKEGFSPNFVEKAIAHSQIKKNDLIIDPFNGSGTTTLTSAILGYQSIGIEVNPFTSFLSSAKQKNVDTIELKKTFEKTFKNCEKGAPSNLIRFSTFSYKKDLEKWLFNKNILNSFEGGWRYSSSIKNPDVKKIINLSLISAIMENCNAIKDGKCLRYRPTWKNKRLTKEDFIQSLTDKSRAIIDDIVSHPTLTEANIIQGDVRKVISSNRQISNFKLCITSPPYLNTFDYTDIYRPELFLGKFIHNSQELYDLRLKTVRSHIQAKWNLPKMSDFGILYDQVMKHLNENENLLMDKNIPLMIQAYFEDIFSILKKLFAKAAADAQIWMVVSNSAYANQEIPVDLIIGDLGTKSGWHLKEVGVLRYVQKRKTKYSPDIIELRESVIIFTRNK
jgi:hypothetical protein